MCSWACLLLKLLFHKARPPPAILKSEQLPVPTVLLLHHRHDGAPRLRGSPLDATAELLARLLHPLLRCHRSVGVQVRQRPPDVGNHSKDQLTYKHQEFSFQNPVDSLPWFCVTPPTAGESVKPLSLFPTDREVYRLQLPSSISVLQRS